MRGEGGENETRRRISGRKLENAAAGRCRAQVVLNGSNQSPERPESKSEAENTEYYYTSSIRTGSYWNWDADADADASGTQTDGGGLSGRVGLIWGARPLG